MSIELTGVSKSYPTRNGLTPILKNLDLLVGEGERVGILGQNGSGKSTLIRILGGTEQPTSGVVRRNMTVSWPLAFGGAFLNGLTGLDNVRFICRLYGVSPGEKLAFVQDFTELGKYLREPVKSYSSGMRARLAFAVSMAIDFDCYLIDEIIAVGDDRFQRKCQLELFEKRSEKALIIVSHSPDFIRHHCDKASVLVAGELVNFDNVDDAYRFYSSHEIELQPHMAETATAPVVHLSASAVEDVAEAFRSTTSPAAFDTFLDSIEFADVPVFDSCDVVGRLNASGESDAAILAVRYLTDRRPNEPLFWVTLGDLLCERRQHVPGVAAYRTALQLDAKSYWGNRNLATELFNVGRYAEAIPIYEVAMTTAPSSTARLELQLRWLDCRTLLDRVSPSDRVESSAHGSAITVVDSGAMLLADGEVVRLAVAGLADRGIDVAQLECTFRAGGRLYKAKPSLARNSIRRLAALSEVNDFAFVHYASIDGPIGDVEVELRRDNELLRRVEIETLNLSQPANIGAMTLTQAAHAADRDHRAEAASLLYGLDAQNGVTSSITRYAENLVAIGLYDEANHWLQEWLGSESRDHPERSFVVDLACVEIARARVLGWREDIDVLLSSEQTEPSTASVLANLGHAKVADGDLSAAFEYYARAAAEAGAHEQMHFTCGMHTAKLAPEVGPAPAVDLEEVGQSKAGIVHLFACDAGYFCRFAAGLVSSSQARRDGEDVVVHAHIVDPDDDALALAKSLQASHGLEFTTEIAPAALENSAVKRAYFTCARFLVAPDILRLYRRPVLITETDCLVNWSWRDLLESIGDADFGHVQSSMWNWTPWTKIPAGIALYGLTAIGLSRADYAARFINYAFEQLGNGAADLWTVDQVALWLAEVNHDSEARSVHLPMTSILTLATGDKANVGQPRAAQLGILADRL